MTTTIIEPTIYQQYEIDRLRLRYPTVKVDPDPETLSVWVECYDASTPDLCRDCGLEDIDHLAPMVDHPHRRTFPLKRFRIAPSGFVQKVALP